LSKIKQCDKFGKLSMEMYKQLFSLDIKNHCVYTLDYNH
jgi:hypothetical protein